MVVVSIGLDIGYFVIKDKMDETFIEQVFHVNTLTQLPESEESPTYVFQFNYYANEDNNGVEMLEILINAYTGINMSNCYGYGVQIINPKDMILETSCETVTSVWTTDYFRSINIKEGGEFHYYNSYDGVSYGATTALNENDIPYVVDVDGVPYAFSFARETLVDIDTGVFGWRCCNYSVATFDYFVSKAYNSISRFTGSDGVYNNLVFEFYDVFLFYQYSEWTGKFSEISDLVYSPAFLGSKVTYHTRGAKVHEDSMFGRLSDYKMGVKYA